MPSKEPKIRALLTAWRVYRMRDICKISKDLYCVRNPGFHGCPSLKFWPTHLIDPDPEIVSSVEHYFLCRCLVGRGRVPAWEMRLIRDVYVAGKMIGITPRHNPSNPTLPPSALRYRFQNEGIMDGERDLAKSGKSAPIVSTPPTY